MVDRYKTRAAGKDKLVTATVVSTGVSEAGDILALDAAGVLDLSVLPAGVGPDVKSILSTENFTAGDYVNIFDNVGTPNVRLADNSNGRDAHGYVVATTTSGANASVYFEGSNTNAASQTIGSRAYLGTGGAIIVTALDEADGVNPGKLSQFLGVYVDANEINTDIDDCITL